MTDDQAHPTTNKQQEPAGPVPNPATTTTRSMDDDYRVPTAIPCVYYVPSLLSAHDATRHYDALHGTVPWEKTPKINRWVALYEDEAELRYRYRDAPTSNSNSTSTSSNVNTNAQTTTFDGEAQTNNSNKPISSCPPIAEIRAAVQDLYYRQTGRAVQFNACLLNFYENGSQRIGWHADREEIGRSTPIASVSLGAARTLLLRHKLHGATDRASIPMAHGSVVFMENVCQTEYVHSVPKETDVMGGRINLTFRCKAVGEQTAGEEEHERRDRWLERITTTNNNNNDKNDEGEEDLDEMLAAEMMRGGRSSPVELFGDNVRVGASRDDEYDGAVRYTVSCNIGTEAQCAAEIREKLSSFPSEGDEGDWDVVARPYGVAGYVACVARGTGTDEDHQADQAAASKLLQLRSALNVMHHHDMFALEDVAETNCVSVSQIDGEMLYAFYKKRLVDNIDGRAPSSLAKASEHHPLTFRVTCERIGDHSFKAPTVEFEMGGACSEVYAHCKPKMTDFDVNLRIDVVAHGVMVGTQLNVEDLSKRHFLRYRNSVTIKTNVAYIMLRLANVREGSVVVDPFCGSGTILLEALEMMDKKCKVIGMDVNRRAAEGAQKNALAEGYGPDRAEFHCSDARGLRRIVGDQRWADAIVSNMPWGVRTGQNQSVNDLQQLYETFLRVGWYVLQPGGRIVMLVLRGLQLVRILRKLGGRYRIIKCMVVRTTNNLPCILVVEKVERDLLHESVKSQLAYMSQFVNVSKEMYQAINNETIDEAN